MLLSPSPSCGVSESSLSFAGVGLMMTIHGRLVLLGPRDFISRLVTARVPISCIVYMYAHMRVCAIRIFVTRGFTLYFYVLIVILYKLSLYRNHHHLTILSLISIIVLRSNTSTVFSALPSICPII